LFKRFKNHFAVVSLMLVVLLLSGCFGGPKTFTVTVQLDTELAGVEIREGSKTGSILGETTEKGVAELKNVKEGTVLVPVKDGYTFKPETRKVTKAGTVAFEAIKDEPSPEPGEKDITSVTNPDAIEVYKDKAPFDQLNLPEKVSVTLADDTKVEVKVEWKAGDYDNTKEGTYTLVGELKPEGDIKNPSNLQAEMKVTVVDAVKKADEKVKEVEALALPAHYNQVAAIEKTIEDAYAAVAQVSDPLTRATMNQKIDAKNSAVQTVLTARVTRVTGANTNEALYEALRAFWDAELKWIDVYFTIKKATPTLNTVHDVQKNLIEKAPVFNEEKAIVTAIVDAANANERALENALIQYRAKFERLNLENDDAARTVLKAYKTAFAGKTTIKDIQTAIDQVNLEQAKAAIGYGVDLKLTSKDLNRANELMAYVKEGTDKKTLQDTLTKLVPIISVIEASNETELGQALADLKAEYVYPELMNKYLVRLAATDKAGLTAATPKDVTDKIQAKIVDRVNKERVDDILTRIDAITNETPLHTVEDLLDLLDKFTPYRDPVSGQKVDFDLTKKDLDFDRTRMEHYKAALASKVVTQVSDVVAAIGSGNDAFYKKLDKFTVKVDSATITDGITFTIKALDKAGKAFVGDLTGYKATISVSGQTASYDLTFGGNTATVTVLGGKFHAVVDSTVADVTISKGTAGQQGYEEYKITSAPFAIGATATTGTVVIDGNKKEFTAGETIKATVTLYYDTNKVLTTESGTYAAVVTIGTKPENRFNRTVKFTKGVAEIEVPANKVDEAQVEVIIAGMPELKTTDAIKIKHAVAAKVAVTDKSITSGKLTGVEVTVQDAKGNRVTSFNGAYDGTVSYALKVELKAQADPPQPNVPDTEGKVSLVFTNGVANIEFGDFLNELQAGKTYVITINVAGFTTQFEYEVPK